MEVIASKSTDCSKLLNANIDRYTLNQELRKESKKYEQHRVVPLCCSSIQNKVD